MTDEKIKYYLTTLAISLAALAGCSKSASDTTKMSDDGFNFKPEYRNINPVAASGTPSVPLNFTLTQQNSSVILKWTIPKIYNHDGSKIGYMVYRKLFPYSDAQAWNFEDGPNSEDAMRYIGSLTAKDCGKDGLCAVSDNGPGFGHIYYAIRAYWDVLDYKSGVSAPAESTIDMQASNVVFSFTEEFTNKVPEINIGRLMSDFDRTADLNIFKFNTDSLSWYLWDPSMVSSDQSSLIRYKDPIFAGVSADTKYMYLPDPGFNRGIRFEKGGLILCDGISTDKATCEQSMLSSSSWVAKSVFGQPSSLTKYALSENPLKAYQKFNSRNMGFIKGPSGTDYVVVADDMRLLFRRAGIDGCDGDGGLIAGTTGAEGKCGFQISVGSFSPRIRCPWQKTGAIKTGEQDCDADDMNYSLADSTSPSSFSLRKPGVPVVIGANLYIPDGANARIVRLSNFEEKFKTCGRILPLGSSETNSFCEFDMVLGQYTALSSDPARFQKRDCVRGGERGGWQGASVLDNLAPFSDPTGGSASGGAACRLDMYQTDPSTLSKARRTLTFKDEGRSDISAETGLLSDSTRRRFRAPLRLETRLRYNNEGKAIGNELYVLDYGFTYAEVDASSLADRATLPPRIMVWNRDPFNIVDCMKADPAVPGAQAPACMIDQDGRCEGEGCFYRMCDGIECNATYILGQPGELFGYTHKYNEILGVNYFPDKYVPIASFAIGKSSAMSGVWAVTGLDNRIIYWPKPSQSAAPIVANAKDDTKDPLFNKGIFSGIILDEAMQAVMGIDSYQSVIFGWRGSNTEYDATIQISK
jgi:hypothetical protein